MNYQITVGHFSPKCIIHICKILKICHRFVALHIKSQVIL